MQFIDEIFVTDHCIIFLFAKSSHDHKNETRIAITIHKILGFYTEGDMI